MQSSLYRVFFFFVFIFIATEGALAQTGKMTTAAGTGTAGYSGNGGPATSAQLNGPYSVMVDAAGNFYIAEWYNHVIRKVTASTGTITTVAGSGSPHFFGDGGPATSAFLNSPEDASVDSSGNLYIADSLNHRIRRVDADSGIISTFAGTGSPGYNGEGQARSAELNDPGGVVVDSAGNVYIADQSNHRIRRVSAATGVISTIAGTGIAGFSGDGGPATSARLYNPVHLALDRSGNLFIADSLNHRVRKINGATGVITTVAGTGIEGFSGDGSSARSAQLHNPMGVAVDAAGNLYIADSVNKRVRRVDASTGVITTVAGGGENGDGCTATTTSLEFPLDVALNSSGDRLYIADFGDNRIRMVVLDESIPVPHLTSISPSSGAQGTSATVTLSGTGFTAGSTNAGCRAGVTTVAITGSGVTVGNVNVISNTSIRATLTIAANAALGARDVTVTTEGGTSNPQKFTVTAPPPPVPPAPTLTSVTPSSALRGTSASVTLNGTNFTTSSGSTKVAVSGTGISVSNVNVASTSSLTATFAIASTATLGNYNVTVSTAGGTSNAVTFAVNPQGITITYGMPAMLNPTEQVPVQLTLDSPSPDPVTGKLSLTFTANASNNADDPNILFINPQTSGRIMDFTFPANSTAAQFSLPGAVLKAGTVAGVIRLTMTEVKVGGKDVTPSSSTFDITIPRLVPAITNVRILNRTSAGFDVEITGYSTSRDITAATFQFAPAAGGNLQTLQLQPDVTAVFAAYYQTAKSAVVGSAFVYVQPFIVQQGDVNAVGSVTVTLTNAQGASQPKTAN